MGTIMDVMLAVRERVDVFYHKDTNEFDYYPCSRIQLETLDPNAKIPYKDTNNFRLPSYEEIDHEDIMRFYVRECVEDKALRKQLFSILRRHDYIDAFLEKLRELDLYEDFCDVCGDIYIDIFKGWVEKNDLHFFDSRPSSRYDRQ